MAGVVLVTGASSGFGRAIAEKFAANGYDVIITGRRGDRLREITKNLSAKYNADIHPLEFDLQDRAACFAAVESLTGKWRSVNLLINNAGLALGRDSFEEASLDDWDTMINTNLKGLLYITKAVLPLMIPAGHGHIINIGSTAGKEVYEKGNTYCATKHAVDAISKAMRIDLLKHRIKVTAVHPGAADTEFSLVRFKGDGDTAGKVYEGYQALAAEDVAGICYYCATLPAHVCVNDLVVTCISQANSFLTFKG